VLLYGFEAGLLVEVPDVEYQQGSLLQTQQHCAALLFEFAGADTETLAHAQILTKIHDPSACI